MGAYRQHCNTEDWFARLYRGLLAGSQARQIITPHPAHSPDPRPVPSNQRPFFAAADRVLWWGLGTMKNSDIKSIIIGALLTSTIFEVILKTMTVSPNG